MNSNCVVLVLERAYIYLHMTVHDRQVISCADKPFILMVLNSRRDNVCTVPLVW